MLCVLASSNNLLPSSFLTYSIPTPSMHAISVCTRIPMTIWDHPTIWQAHPVLLVDCFIFLFCSEAYPEITITVPITITSANTLTLLRFTSSTSPATAPLPTFPATALLPIPQLFLCCYPNSSSSTIITLPPQLMLPTCCTYKFCSLAFPPRHLHSTQIDPIPELSAYKLVQLLQKFEDYWKIYKTSWLNPFCEELIKFLVLCSSTVCLGICCC